MNHINSDSDTEAADDTQSMVSTRSNVSQVSIMSSNHHHNHHAQKTHHTERKKRKKQKLLEKQQLLERILAEDDEEEAEAEASKTIVTTNHVQPQPIRAAQPMIATTTTTTTTATKTRKITSKKKNKTTSKTSSTSSTIEKEREQTHVQQQQQQQQYSHANYYYTSTMNNDDNDDGYDEFYNNNNDDDEYDHPSNKKNRQQQNRHATTAVSTLGLPSFKNNNNNNNNNKNNNKKRSDSTASQDSSSRSGASVNGDAYDHRVINPYLNMGSLPRDSNGHLLFTDASSPTTNDDEMSEYFDNGHGKITMKLQSNQEEYPEITLEEIAANTVINGSNAHSQYSLHQRPVRLLLFKVKRAIQRMSIWSKLFLCITFVMLLTISVSATTNIILMLSLNMEGTFYSHYFLHALNIAQCLMLLFLVIEALFTENEYQLITFVLSSLIMTARIIYSLIQITIVVFKPGQKAKTIVVQVLTTILPALLILLFQIALIVLVVPVFKSFGWKLYRVVGASPHLIRHYRTYSIYVSMVRMDLLCIMTIIAMAFFFISFAWWSYVGLGLAVLLSVALAPLSITIGAQREYASVMIFFVLLSFALPMYLLYKMIEVWRTSSTGLNLPHYVTSEERTVILALFTAFGCLCILWRLLLIVAAVLVTFNFRKGLADVFAQRRLKRKLKAQKGFSTISVSRLLKGYKK